MKVYAEYFEENGLRFRRNTILQFGDSWDLIGNAVLANPGSAEPLHKVSSDMSNNLELFYKSYRDHEPINIENWYEFSDDATMQRLERIFNGWYVSDNILELNGVVQLFNTFNIKNQDLKAATESISETSDFLFSKGVEKYFHDKPTYFGFSNDVLYHERLRPLAEDIFNNSSKKVKAIYSNDFSDNSFYHPTYVNRAYKQDHFSRYRENVLIPLFNLVSSR